MSVSKVIQLNGCYKCNIRQKILVNLTTLNVKMHQTINNNQKTTGVYDCWHYFTSWEEIRVS